MLLAFLQKNLVNIALQHFYAHVQYALQYAQIARSGPKSMIRDDIEGISTT